MDFIAPKHLGHVEGLDNLADCAWCGLSPFELLCHELWYNGTNWLRLDPTVWPMRPQLKPDVPSKEVDELCQKESLDRYSTYTKLGIVMAWVICFVQNCQVHKKSESWVSYESAS